MRSFLAAGYSQAAAVHVYGLYFYCPKVLFNIICLLAQ